MSRKARVEHQIRGFIDGCISRVEPESSPHKFPCEHAPDGNMVWGEPPEPFCPQCIHYQRGHVEEASEGD